MFMHGKLMKKLEKKDKKLDPLEKEAKMGVVKALSKQASSMLGDKVHPMKKVSVAADSKEGLKEGLDKAAGLVDKLNGHQTDPEKLVEESEEELGADLDQDNEDGESPEHSSMVEGSPEEEASESSDEENQEMLEECAHDSPEQLDKKIQALIKLKMSKK